LGVPSNYLIRRHAHRLPGWRSSSAVYHVGGSGPRLHTKDGKIEGRELNRLWGWVDADFAADLDTRRSHTGYSVNQKSVSLITADDDDAFYLFRKRMDAASEAGNDQVKSFHLIMREFGFPHWGLHKGTEELKCRTFVPICYPKLGHTVFVFPNWGTRSVKGRLCAPVGRTNWNKCSAF
jgi:hypothetical protein